jgi:hypothetical protein
MTELEYITDLELRLAVLQAKIDRKDKNTILQKAHELFCRHALRITGVGAFMAFVLAWLLGRGGFQPLLAGFNVAGALLVLRIGFCRELPELKCMACNRDIARPLLFALAALFSLFAAGHLTGAEILMSLAISFEHAALFVVAILGNRHWECIAWNFSQQNGCN